MSISISGLMENKLVFFLFSLGLGSLVTALVNKIQNKTRSITYTTRIDRIALSSEDPIFGSVKITWRDNPVHNLYSCNIEFENSTFQDFENICLKLYTGEDTFLFNERTGIVGTPYALDWSPKFKETIEVHPPNTPTELQKAIYSHSREYLVPVFNRNQKITFTLLCTRPGILEPPIVSVSALAKGIKLHHQTVPNIIFGVPANIALIRGLLLTIIIALVSGIFLKPRILVVIACTVSGLSCALLGALMYRAEKAVRNWFAG